MRRAWPANNYDLALMKIVAAMVLFANAAFAQMVIGPEQIPCSEEVVCSNFELKDKDSRFKRVEGFKRRAVREFEDCFEKGGR